MTPVPVKIIICNARANVKIAVLLHLLLVTSMSVAHEGHLLEYSYEFISIQVRRTVTLDSVYRLGPKPWERQINDKLSAMVKV